MNRLEEEICRILRSRFRCLCGTRPPYCGCVVDVANLVLKECEKEPTAEFLDVSASRLSSEETKSRDEKKPLTIQETLVLLRSRWERGYDQDFDTLVIATKVCSIDEAESLRKKWLAEGIIAYDPEGWLVWCNE